jgi:hypothetical protein
MKLKTLIYLNEWSGVGSLTSGETDLIPWDGVTEGKGWFLYCGSNNHNTGNSIATVYLTEGEPKRLWIKLKTKNLRRPKDTNESSSHRSYELTKKLGKAWCSEAKRLFKQPKAIDRVGNPLNRTWEEAFKEALQSPRLRSVVEAHGETKASVDPVNFTPVTPVK